ncbi:MAG TPA: choice-of-anchor Q domain-containing protein [Actinomycetota bacterium]
MGRRGGAGAVVLVVLAGLLALVPGAASAAGPVHCATQDLQARLNSAQPGATILVDGTCDGPFTVGKNVTIRGNPTATLDGGQAGTTLAVNTPHVVHLEHLVVTGGWSTNGVGGGVSVGGGKLFLDHVTVRDNVSIAGAAGIQACGGGVRGLDGAEIHIAHSSIIDNTARTTQPNPSGAFGGGICTTDQGSLTVAGSKILRNRASMVAASGPAHAGGAGITALDVHLTITSSSVDDNVASADGSPVHIDGAGIWNPSVHVPTVTTMTASFVRRNHANAHSSSGEVDVFGGGINGDTVTATDSTFLDNDLHGRADGGFAQVEGGGVWAGTVTFTNSAVRGSNLHAVGGFSAQVHGGAIWSDQKVTVTGSTFADDHMVASGTGTGPSAGASGLGGAISSGALAVITGSTFTSNSVRTTASQAGATADGGAVDGTGQLRLVRSTLSGNTATAASQGNDSAFAAGGGAEAGDVTLTSTTVDSNQAIATTAADDASATAGGVFAHGQLRVTASTLSGNHVQAASHGATIASATSGAFEAGGAGHIVNSTVAGNSADAVADTGVGEARAFAGALFGADNAVTFESSTVVRNSVAGRGHTVTAAGGGLVTGFGTITLTSTILALNTAPSEPDCAGIDSGGHNLVGTTAGCGFTKKPTDKVNIANPQLGPLHMNGGHTRTIALLVGSPALDWIPAAQCGVAADQRGVHRPQGPRCDVGAYERKP